MSQFYRPRGSYLGDFCNPCSHLLNLTRAQKVLRPHRYAYQLITGQRPQGHVLHQCDFPLCVHADVDNETSHLRDGTNAENVADRAARKRSGNQHTSTSIAGAPRIARYELMIEIRDWAKANGFDRARIAGYVPDASTLF